MCTLFDFYFFQSKAEVEHADILELNTIITTLKEEKEQIEKEKVCAVKKLVLLFYCF